MYVYVYVYMYMDMDIYIYIYIYKYIYIYIYICDRPHVNIPYVGNDLLADPYRAIKIRQNIKKII